LVFPDVAHAKLFGATNTTEFAGSKNAATRRTT
jgi:hypothetical protein